MNGHEFQLRCNDKIIIPRVLQIESLDLVLTNTVEIQHAMHEPHQSKKSDAHFLHMVWTMETGVQNGKHDEL